MIATIWDYLQYPEVGRYSRGALSTLIHRRGRISLSPFHSGTIRTSAAKHAEVGVLIIPVDGLDTGCLTAVDGVSTAAERLSFQGRRAGVATSGEGRLLRLYGTKDLPTPCRVLSAGALSVWFEEGNLRYVTFNGEEVLRAVSYVIRDADWGTYQPLLSNLVIEEDETRFRISYDGVCKAEASTLTFHAEIVGEAEGVLRFSVEATPDRSFETNRCGFTVLHPLQAAGRPVEVEHVDGTVEQTSFPELIEPWQPFKSIRSLTYRPGGLFDATCRMEGDVFEMEDQRNWSDASFKTYVRPIELPWPYELAAGETHRQSVSLTISGVGRENAAAPAVLASKGPTLMRAEKGEGALLPPIGVVIAPEEIEDALAAVDHLTELAPQTILCHYDPTVGHGPAALAMFARLQRSFHARYSLECVVEGRSDPADELGAVAAALKATELKLSSIAVCPSADRQSTPPGSEWPNCPPLADIYNAARAAFPDLPIGGGMFSYFTELNRKRPPADLIDFVTHATNPIVHAADDRSVMETLTTLPHITRSTRAIIGQDKPYRIGPSTIGMRQNPYGSRTMPNPDRNRVCMADADPRQDSLFAAAWTIGYAAAVAPAGLDLLTLSAFTGPRGVLAEDGRLRAVFQAVKWLAACAGVRAVPLAGDDPMIAALGAMDGGRFVVLLANLSAEPRRVDLGGAGAAAGISVLDAEAVSHPRDMVLSDRLALDSFAIARIVFQSPV